MANQPDKSVYSQKWYAGNLNRGTLFVANQAASTATWGSIDGTLSAQTDLNSALTAKLNLSSYTAAGALVYGTGSATVGTLTLGTSGYVLTAGASAPQWSAASSVSVGTATNIAGGSANSLVYQTGVGATGFITAGSNGKILTMVGGVPAWATAANSSPLTTKGDIYTFSTVDARLPVGTNGQVLSADSTATTGLKWIAAGSTGTVTSVALSDASSTPIYSISGSPVTTTGTLTVTLATQSANKIFAGPTSGGAAQPTFRSLVAADLTGLVVSSITGTANQVIASASTGAVTLSLPQSINTTATPTFNQVTITNAPTSGTDAVNKTYADALIQGLSFKEACAAATAAALPTIIYANGASGVGATLTGAALGALTVDGYSVALNDRILVKNQVSGLQNGIYSVTTLGTAFVAFILTRTTDADTSAKLLGAYTFIENGTVNADTSWANTNTSTITIGTTAVTFAQFSGAGTYSAGTGITLTGSTFSLTSPVTATLGGTGVANSNTITLGGNISTAAAFTTSGANALTLTTTGSTNVTLPTTGTLVNSAVTTLSSLTSIGTLGALAVTGTTTQTGALNFAGASSPLQVGGSAGTSGQVLTSAGAGATPTWNTVTGTGTVTSVAMSVPAFLSISGSPITTSGTLAVTLSGTALPIANGGTGQTTAAAAMTALSPITTTGDIIYSSSGTTNSRLAVGNAGDNLTTVSGVPAWQPNQFISGMFGDGSDGAFTSSSGTTNLTRDTYYTNVTLSGTAVINTKGWRLFVSGTLDISAAGWTGSITNSGGAGGSSASTGAGTAGSQLPYRIWSTDAGVNGRAGGTTTGTAGITNNVGFVYAGGNVPGSGGTGGSGSSGAGGAGATASNGPSGAASGNYMRYPSLTWYRAFGNDMAGGLNGASGGSGGGDGTIGGGSGAGGMGGSVVGIYAKTINRASAGSASCIIATGGVGGNGGQAAGGNRGGGGGGGGGCGGHIYIVCNNLTGTTQTNALDASGGNGGTGGALRGTGTAGGGGVGGGGGTIVVFILSTSVSPTVTDNGASAGGAASGTTGGTGLSTKQSL